MKNNTLLTNTSKESSFFLTPEGGGILLFIAALAGLVLANSPLAPFYDFVTQGTLPFGEAGRHETLVDLISVGPMSLFFMAVVIEIKKEFVSGYLSTFRAAVLPAISALGGILVPTLFYLAVSYGNAQAMRGWAIPTATDAAFTLPIVLVLARHVSDGARVWLMALAIFDDIVGIAIIAFCYGSSLNFVGLGVALAIIMVMIGLNRACIQSLWAYSSPGAACGQPCLFRESIQQLRVL